ncbi:DUF4188 domain-containing protein [Jatrophihabitans sp. YIM 134969]
MVKAIRRERSTSVAPDGTVVFLIGMRVNRPWKLWKWLPVARQMPLMLRELSRRPEQGLLQASSFVSGLTILTLQYWESAAKLNAYATARDAAHLPAWREFNRKVKDNGDVGIFHETYVLGTHETIYVNMPENFGLIGATAAQPVGSRGQRALHRLDPSVPDEPVVEPY